MQVLKRNNFLLFFLGISFTIPVQFIGNFMLGEIICFLFFIFSIKFTFSLYRQLSFLRKFSFLYLLSFILILFSTLYNGNGNVALFKAIANHLFIFTSFISLLIILRKDITLILPLLIGLTFGKIITPSHIHLDINLLNSYYFEIYTAVFTPFLIFLGIVLNKRKFIVSLIYISFGLFSLYNEARSVGFIFILAPLIFTTLKLTRNYNILFTVLTISITSIFIFNTYVDYFSDNNSIIYDSNGNEVSGVIDFMNRNDTYIGFLAFLDKPLLGHGYDKQTNKYYKFALDNGLLPSYTEFKNRIPTHSTIVGNAVSGGVLASLCWLYFYFLLIRWFIFVVNKGVNSDFSIVIILIILYCLWNLAFSPYGFVRYSFPYLSSFLIIYFYFNKTSLNIKKYKN